jgi:hypothetical protein
MRYFSEFGLRSMLLTSAILAAAAMEPVKPAAAQGGIVCEFGTAQYKRCCTESYRRRPNLGASARADDIDACVNRRSREEKPREEKPREDRGEKSARTEPAASATNIRRLDCGTGGCPEGCAPDEIAISAFCAANTFPTVNGDRDVQCSSSGNAQRPSVLICAKR